MKNHLKLVLKCLLVFFSFSILANAQGIAAKISIKNNLNFDRKEIMSVSGKELSDLIKGKKETEFRIKKEGTQQYRVLQWIDYNQDGVQDELLIQARLRLKQKSIIKWFLMEQFR